MDLSTAIKNCQSMLDLQSIITDANGAVKAEAQLSCLGGRYIQAIGYEGTAGIDDLASRVIELVWEKKFEYSQEERDIGKIVATHITRLYDTSDQQLQNSNCLTRLIYTIRDISDRILRFFIGKPRSCYLEVRWEWKEDPIANHYCDVFSYYTYRQCQERFGRLLPPAFMEGGMLFAKPFDHSFLHPTPPPLIHENEMLGINQGKPILVI